MTDLTDAAGFAVEATIRTDGAAALQAFLADHGHAPAYLVEHPDEAGDHETVAWRVAVDAATDADGGPVVTGDPLPPGADRIRLGLAEVTAVYAGEPPADACRLAAETERAAADLVEIAEAAPSLIDLTDLTGLLASDEPAIRDRGLAALAPVARRRPFECLDTVPLLVDLVETPHHAERALARLAQLAGVQPTPIASHAERLVPFLVADTAAKRREAASCLSATVDLEPELHLDGVPGFAALLADRVEGMADAAIALDRLARHYPGHVRPASEALTGVVRDTELPDSVRGEALSALATVTGAFPAAGTDVVDGAVGALRSSDRQLRSSAGEVLRELATHQPDAVGPYVQELDLLLDAGDDRTRREAVAVLDRLAASAPERVAPAEPTFVDLLADDDASVRWHACRVVGRLESSAAVDELVRLAAFADDEPVAEQAVWALAEVR